MRTKKRAFVHAYMINHQRANNGRAPSVQAIADHFGTVKSSAYAMLLSMAADGIVNHDYGTEPAFTAIETPAINAEGKWSHEPA